MCFCRRGVHFSVFVCVCNLTCENVWRANTHDLGRNMFILKNTPPIVCVCVCVCAYSEELGEFMESKGASSPGILTLTTNLSKPFMRLDKYPTLLKELERHMEVLLFVSMCV